MSSSPSQAPKTPQEQLQAMETPRIKWGTIGTIAGAFALLWLVTLMSAPSMPTWAGYTMYGVMAALTLAGIGFGIYVWRMTRKQAAMMEILKGAVDAPGRKEALARLEAGDPKDAMNALARAQLVAQDDRQKAIEILEGVDLAKAPVTVQDDLRANLAMLYLSYNKVREARSLADDIRLDRAGQAKAKAMYAAIIAEAFARTTKAEDAKKLLETYRDDDPEYGEMRVLLLRSQVFTYFATKNRGLARKAMDKLASVDPNHLGAFMQAGNPEMSKMVREVLSQAGVMPKQQMKVRMR